MAVILGIISLLSLGAVVFLSYRDNGVFEMKYGAVALLSAVYSLIGLLLGVVTVLDRNYYRLFPALGIALNMATLAGISLILYMGANLE